MFAGGVNSDVPLIPTGGERWRYNFRVVHRTGVSDFPFFIRFVRSICTVAQLAEQVTLNFGRSEVIRPVLPNTLRKFRMNCG